MEKSIVCDIDGVICTNVEGKYKEAKPIKENIKILNELRSKGVRITFLTSRGYATKENFTDLTIEQFKEWGVKYDALMFGKPPADVYIDDKAFNSTTEDLNCLLQKLE